MSGWIKLHRGWMENEVFTPEPFSRPLAWVWLVENACWRPTKTRIKGEVVALDRGELSVSLRFLATKWGWSKSRVDRFLAELRREGMIETRSKIGTTARQHAGQGQSIITICNYSKYQDKEDDARDSDDQKIGTTAGQQRDKEEERKEDKKKEDYAFAGRTIRLTHSDFKVWETNFHAIPDLRAELTALDGWLQGETAGTKKKWFQAVGGALAKKHQAFVVQARARDAPPEMLVPC